MVPKTLLSVLVVGFLLYAPVAVAQEYATVRDVEGKAFVQAGDENEPQPLTRNTPLTDGDTLWTNAGGRLGLMLKDGNRIWLDESSRIEAEQFPGADSQEGRTLKVRLWKGAVLLEVASWNGRAEDFLFATPSALVTAREEGLFLIQIETVDRTRVTSLRGRCGVASGGSSVELDMGQTTYAEYGYEPLAPAAADMALSPTLVEYRNLCSRSPNGVPSEGQSRQFLAPDLYAYAPDLDENGSWASVEGYGDCWVPEGLAADWTPYSNGHWTYADWGMTWVPYEPWGWVPFHYGSWFLSAALGWAWYPGSIFAPAWCSWYWGPDYIGWCPLDRWGYPLWGSAGWNSCGMGDIYNHNAPFVNHRTAPPPNPIYPRPHANPGTRTTRTGEPGVTRNSRGPDVTPRDVRDYNRGKLSSDVMKKRALDTPARMGSSSAQKRSLSNQDPRGTTSPGTRNSGQASPGRSPRSDDSRMGTRPSPNASDRGNRSGTGSLTEPRKSGDAPTNPRRSWSPSTSEPRGDTTRRSEGRMPRNPNSLDRDSSPWRANPRQNPKDGAPSNPGDRGLDRSSPRNYSGRGYDSRPRSGQQEFGQPPSRNTPNRNYNSQPRQGRGLNEPSRPRSGQSPNRAIPSRPSPPVAPRGGYSPGNRGGNSPGRSYSAPKTAPPSGSSGRTPSQSPGSRGSGSSGSGSRSSGSNSGNGGHRR